MHDTESFFLFTLTTSFGSWAFRLSKILFSEDPATQVAHRLGTGLPNSTELRRSPPLEALPDIGTSKTALTVSSERQREAVKTFEVVLCDIS